MWILLWMCGSYLLLALQTTICPSIAVGPFAPNLLIALAVPCFYRHRSQWAVCGAALWGLAVDLLGTGVVGINLIGFTIVTAILLRRQPRPQVSPLRLMTVTAPAVFLLTAFHLAANYPWQAWREHTQELGVLWVGSSLYSCAIATAWIVCRQILQHNFSRLAGHEPQDRQWSRPAIPW